MLSRLYDWKELLQSASINFAYTGVPAVDRYIAFTTISATMNPRRIVDIVLLDSGLSWPLTCLSARNLDVRAPNPVFLPLPWH